MVGGGVTTGASVDSVMLLCSGVFCVGVQDDSKTVHNSGITKSIMRID